jgi:transcription elongation factor GreA|tara:strand:+ start:89 stop:568 length:480 start_codon:yes stop_codon:yes gene_type:complete
MEKVFMTQFGNDSLREELKMLVSKDRPEIINAIASARKFGDLKENAEYHAAKEKQSFIEGRILEIESKLSNAEVIDVTKLDIKEKVVFGSTVKLKNIDSKSVVKYKIVGEDEADIDKGLISYLAPVSRAIIGKSLLDIVEFKSSKGKIIFKILSIEYIL